MRGQAEIEGLVQHLKKLQAQMAATQSGEMEHNMAGMAINTLEFVLGKNDMFSAGAGYPGDPEEHDLATALDSYTDPTSPEYDPDFDRQIRELRPDWFAKPS